MSEWDQTGAEAPERPPPKTPGWDAGAPADPAWGERTLRGLAAGMRVFGRFSLERMLGRGGMGVVWLALDQQLGLEVALKFLPDMVAHDRMALEDLREETLRSLRLTHPHIVRVYDFHQDGGCAAIAMEYVDGDTLSNLRLGRPGRVFTTGELLPWLQQACEALEYAHSRAKIVHRDLKPANLMVNSAGEVRITDFGIARSLAESMTRVSGNIGTSGTLVYMSPQQARGIPPSPADDIYSLGATLYDLLTGKPPFYSGEIYQQILTELPPPMAQRRAELGVVGEPIPREWEAVVAGCLDKEAARRPGSAQEIVARLSSTFNNQHSTTNFQGRGSGSGVLGAGAGAPSGEQRATRAESGKRNTGKRRAAAMAIGFLLVVLGGAVWYFGQYLPEQEAARARAAEAAETARKAEEGRKAAEAERQRMEALTGTVEVRSEPPGAAVVWGDGRRLGVTPLRLDKVPSGEVTVRLEMEGYESGEARGTVVGGRETALSMTLKRAVAGPATATKEGPFENSLGMRFVPSGTPGVLFCVWETRVKDFEAFVRETRHDTGQTMFVLKADGWSERDGYRWRNPGFEQGPEHPVVGVSWEDARAFCLWLTQRERGAGRIGPRDEYRLPSDHEWSVAVGIGDRESARASPKEKDAKIEGVYPWGTQWPPPRGAGNYAGEESRIGQEPSGWGVIDGYRDGYARTAPAGSFSANGLGLYDMGGNVWEWCQDLYDAGQDRRVLRGASWCINVEAALRSSYRDSAPPGFRNDISGFRCVLSASGS